MTLEVLEATQKTSLLSNDHCTVSESDLSRFVSAQGMRIVPGESCLWVEKKRSLLESAPPHRRIRVRPEEAKRLFRSGAIAIRYTCAEDEGSATYEYLWDDKNFGLDSLDRDARRRVKKSLQETSFQQIGYDLLARDGLAINRSVFERQGRTSDDYQIEESKWRKYLKVCESLSFLEPYGLFIDQHLAAYCIAFFVDDYCYTFHPYASTEYLKYSPMNVLIYSIVKMALARPSVRFVSYGVESYTSRPTLEHFKIAMGCRKAMIGRKILVHPLARPLFSASGAAFTKAMLRLFKPKMADDFGNFALAVQGRELSLSSSDPTGSR